VFTTFTLPFPVSIYSQYCSVLRGLTGPVFSVLLQRAYSRGLTLISQHRRKINSRDLAKSTSTCQMLTSPRTRRMCTAEEASFAALWHLKLQP